MLNKLKGRKAYVVGVATIAWGIWLYLVEQNPAEGIQRVMEGLAIITLRQGIAKVVS